MHKCILFALRIEVVYSLSSMLYYAYLSSRGHGDLTSKWEKLNTEALMHAIMQEPEQMRDALESGEYCETCSLTAHLAELIDDKDMTIGEIIVRSCLSKPFVYQVFSGVRAPGRDVLLRMAFAMELTLAQTQRLLTIGSRPQLYPKVRRDAAVMCCLEQKLPLRDAAEFIERIGERPLL